jgi:hypothetical protein
MDLLTPEQLDLVSARIQKLASDRGTVLPSPQTLLAWLQLLETNVAAAIGNTQNTLGAELDGIEEVEQIRTVYEILGEAVRVRRVS